VRDLSITLVQSDLRWQDPEANRQRLGAALETELDTSGGSDLVILPEMFTTGFCMEAAANAETMTGPTLAWMRDTAAATGAVITGSLIIEEQGRYFNRLIWMPPAGEPDWYDKRHLFRMVQEDHHYSPGDRLLTVQLKGWRVRPLICYDLRFPVWSRNRKDYDLLFYVANWPTPRREVWRLLLPARAAENLAWVAAVNRVGRDANGFEYSGDSCVIDPQGKVMFSKTDAEFTRTFTLSRELLERSRERFPAHLDADDFRLEL